MKKPRSRNLTWAFSCLGFPNIQVEFRFKQKKMVVKLPFCDNAGINLSQFKKGDSFVFH